MFLFGYLLLALVVFIINIIPAFMPPTWTILAYVYITYHLFFIPTIFLGAVFATLGRIILYYLAKNYFHVFFSKQSKKNFSAAGKYLNKRKRITIPLLILYAFIPIPSNQVYIAAGFAKLDIRIMAVSFFIGRLISYTFWVGATKIGKGTIETLFIHHLTKRNAIILDILGFVILYLISIIPWQKMSNKVI